MNFSSLSKSVLKAIQSLRSENYSDFCIDRVEHGTLHDKFAFHDVKRVDEQALDMLHGHCLYVPSER